MYVHLNLDNIQKAAVLYTKIYTRHCFQNRDIERLGFVIENMMNFMGDSMVALALRKLGASTLNYILLADKGGVLKKNYYANIVPTLLNFLSSQMNLDPVFLGLNIEILLTSSPHLTSELLYFIKGGFINFCCFSLNLI